MTKQTADIVYNKISEYDKIVISRHVRPDGDAVGSSMGLKEIIKASFPNKQVFYVGEDKADYIAFFESEDPQPSDEFYAEALLIVLDVSSEERLSNDKKTLAKEVLKIDHHIEDAPYGDISIVEEERSSTCEMIVDLFVKLDGKLTMTKKAAEYLYIGMVTDSGRFRYSGTTGETLRYASLLLDFDIDTARIFANLYLDEFDNLCFRNRMFSHIQQTENGVAYLYISKQLREEEKITMEQASQTIVLMDSIKNDLIWLVFLETDEGDYRVRLRSRFIGIKDLASKYSGGGHENASGATCHSLDEVKALVSDADKLLCDFKKNNSGWI